ncbi:MAG TPA: rod shape-determining protein MreC [Candidatus Aminicenantes bacterium]|nr:rod shape-determining protein MreC [Candidatus Aminicenantes bacterium]
MPFDSDRAVPSPEKRALFLVIVLFIDLILISSQVVLKNNRTLLHNVIAGIASPFQVGVSRATGMVTGGLRRYVFLQGAHDRYQDLEARYMALRQEMRRLQNQLREAGVAAHVAGMVSTHFRIARPLFIDPNFPYHSLLIDLGSHQGVRENMTVLNGEGELVGRVVQPITQMTATVRLITSPIGGVGAAIGPEELAGLLTGTNTAECSFRYVMENKPVALGDRVYTSGTDLLFPPFIPIGRVVRVEKGYLTQTIMVKPFFTSHSLQKLIILWP